MKQKLTSRKFWAAILGIVLGLATVFGVDENIISTVSGSVVAVASVVTYIIMEGKIDAESVKTAIEKVEDASELISKK